MNTVSTGLVLDQINLWQTSFTLMVKDPMNVTRNQSQPRLQKAVCIDSLRTSPPQILRLIIVLWSFVGKLFLGMEQNSILEVSLTHADDTVALN